MPRSQRQASARAFPRRLKPPPTSTLRFRILNPAPTDDCTPRMERKASGACEVLPEDENRETRNKIHNTCKSPRGTPQNHANQNHRGLHDELNHEAGNGTARHKHTSTRLHEEENVKIRVSRTPIPNQTIHPLRPSNPTAQLEHGNITQTSSGSNHERSHTVDPNATRNQICLTF